MSKGLSILKAEELLYGAIDLHCHGYPEISLENRMRLSTIESCAHAAAAGLRAVVLKSHVWPTTGSTYLLQRLLPNIKILAGATLDLSSGGVYPWFAEMAIREGARLIWMPTWSARFDLERGALLHHMHRYIGTLQQFGVDDGITILEHNGKLCRNVQEVVQLTSELGIPLSTGHLSPAEALALAMEASTIGMKNLIFGHPLYRASRDDIRKMAKLGAYIELTALSIMPQLRLVKIEEMVEVIREVGAEHCVISSDAFFEWSPPPAELLRILITSLLDAGVTAEEIELMVRINPAVILGLDP